MSLCYYNNNDIDYKYARGDEDYHFELVNLNDDQYYGLVNNTKYSNHGEDQLYVITEHAERNRNSIDNTRHDLKIKLKGELSSSLRLFEKRYGADLEANGDGNYSISYTPIVQYEKNAAANRRVFILALFAMFAVSFFLMLLLFSFRLNHFKFTYGIYLTFGANFKKLFTSSFWEMTTVTLVTYLPSCLVSYLLAKFIYASGGATFAVHGFSFLIVLLFTFAVTSLSVLAPITALARSMPVKALAAEDNSNFVSVPRRSSERTIRRFPYGYLAGNIIRFRKYLIKLILCGMVFGTMFVGGSYFAKLYSEKINYNYPAFTVDFSGGEDSYDDSMYDTLVSIDGVTDVKKTRSTSAVYVKSHLLLDPSDVGAFTGLLSYTLDGEKYKVSGDFSFSPLDAGMADYLQKNYDCDGDVGACVDSSDLIAISDSRYNSRIYKFKPGDKVKIAVFLSSDTKPESVETGKAYMRQQLECNSYSYRTYTVGAVIHGMPAGSETPIYMPCIDYSLYTGESSEYVTADVYTEKGLTDAQRSAVGDKLRTFGYKYDNTEIVDNFANTDTHELEKNYYRFALILSWLVLIISPVVWMFAQILFYLKREGEIYVLEAFGASRREIRTVYFGEGAISAVVSALIFTACSLIVTRLICTAANRIAPEPGFAYALPAIEYICGFIFTSVSAFLSAAIPYFVYNRKKSAVMRAAASDERI